MKQYYINHECYAEELESLFRQLGVSNILLVCGRFFFSSFLNDFFDKAQKNSGISYTFFTDFSSNPTYESVRKGVEVFKQGMYDMIIAVGGGSTIDVAKCIKLYGCVGEDTHFIVKRVIGNNGVPLLAIPTTAGSGSEATQFAVIYVDGEKQSVEHESILPQYVLLHPDILHTLPVYQRKATVCDALSHAIESYWSINSTIESKRLSEDAISSILCYMNEYLENDENSYEGMLRAANYAGRAINITRTTAAHAMSYKMTSMLNIAHGHAVMLCLPEIWEYMISHLDACVDVRGSWYLQENLDTLAYLLKQNNSMEAIHFLKQIRSRWGLDLTIHLSEKQKRQLVDSVNIERLKNFPIALSKENLESLYESILVETK